MPNKYVRKSGISRGLWSQENLTSAIEAIENGSSVRSAANAYNIPRKTLERRYKCGKTLKGNMGPESLLGKDNERRLVRHIKDMQNRGFPLTRDDVRTIAFHFTKQLKIKHSFNEEKEKAGYDWLKLFLSRNPDLSLRKSEGVSLNRVHAMNRKEVQEYFNLLEKCLEENELFDKPGHIFNMDESGLQLNTRPGIVLAAKGSKNVSNITSTERGETITIIACCNAEGNFLPPACVMKGKIKKAEYTDNMPPGSVLYMSQKSAYVNSNIFLEWLKNHFLPRKPEGKVLLILDGHASHSSSVEMLEFANEKNIQLLCLPSHTTHYLQPLDRAVFKSVKSNFYASCQLWMKNNPGRRITRYQFGEILQMCWGKSATPENAIAGFRSTGIYPFNPRAIPDHAFSVADNNSSQTDNNESFNVSTNMPKADHSQPNSLNMEPVPSTSKQVTQNLSPFTKVISEVSPKPLLTENVRKRAKKVAVLLTSPEHLQEVKAKNINKLQKNNTSKLKISKRKRKEYSSSSEEQLDEPTYSNEDSGDEDFGENECVGCGEDYEKTTKKDDWIRCVRCQFWLHESCTNFIDLCHRCGKLCLKQKL